MIPLPKKPPREITIHWRPQPRQATFLQACGVLGVLDGLPPTPPVARVIGYGGAAGGGKLLALDTPIPTPSGWTTMCDLAVGDQIFDADGRPTTVIGAFDIEQAPDSYRLVFDDGSIILAGADHRWLTFNVKELAALTRRTPEWRAKRRAKRPSRAKGNKSAKFAEVISARNGRIRPQEMPAPAGTIRNTKEIYNTLRTAKGRANHAIPIAGELDLPVASLLIDPYCLGAWLGDGSSCSAGFTTADQEIIDAFTAAGYRPRLYKAPVEYYIDGMRADLRRAGLIGNKHIPQIYLRASREQRLALLQGLMDTDGTVCDSGSVEFTTTNRRLAEGVYELVVSLGWKSRIVEGRAKLYGRDCGPAYNIKWTPSDYVFRLSRKRDKQRLATRRTTKFRYIVQCEPIDPVPMRCIAVDSPSHLYLAGRSMIPTHNSDALLGVALAAGLYWRGISIGYFRREYPMLEGPGGAIIRSHELMSGWAQWKGDLLRWIFPTGSLLEFCHAKNELDVHKYQSQQFDIILIDEATQFTRYQYRYLLTRNRATRNGVIPFMALATNPGNEGHAWFKAEFADLPPETPYDVEVEPGYRERHVFIPARLSDNLILEQRDPGYRATLEAQPEMVRKQLLEGDWSAFAGQYFPSWRREIHVIPTPKDIQGWLRAAQNHKKFRCLDYGLDMTACYWIDIAPGGRLTVYRELYKPDLILSKAAKLITGATTPLESIAYTVASPDLWNRRQDTGKSGLEILMENGLKGLIKADDRRVPGWMHMAEWLEPYDDPETGKPASNLVFFDCCGNAIRQIPNAIRDEHDPSDVSDKIEDHGIESLRYGLMSRPKPRVQHVSKLAEIEEKFGPDSAEAIIFRKHNKDPRRKGVTLAKLGI